MVQQFSKKNILSRTGLTRIFITLISTNLHSNTTHPITPTPSHPITPHHKPTYTPSHSYNINMSRTIKSESPRTPPGPTKPPHQFPKHPNFIHKLNEAMAVRGGAFRWSRNGRQLLVNERQYELRVKRSHPHLVVNPSFANLKRQLKEYGFTWPAGDLGEDDDLVCENVHFTRDNTDIDGLMRAKFIAKTVALAAPSGRRRWNQVVAAAG